MVKELQYLVPDCQFLLDGDIADIKRSANKKERKLLKKEYKQRRKDIYNEFNEKNPNADKMFKIFVNYYWMYYEYMDSYNNNCE